MERTFDADDKYLHEAIAFVEGALEEHDAGMKEIMAITVAVEEIFVNICHYAYEGSSGKLKMGLLFDGDDVEITFTDSGMPFDPLAKPDPDVKAEAKDRQIGGLGIFMVKKSMDMCKYERRDGLNIFTMRKAIR